MWRIEIMPAIHLHKLTFPHKRLSGLPLAQQIAALEKITIFESFSGHPLRRKHQHAFAIEHEKVRAFPHVAHLFFSHCQHAHILPLAQIGRTINAHLARLTVPRTDNHVPALPFTPHLRVAEVMQTWRGINNHSLPDKMNAVTAGRQTLHLVEIRLVIRIAVEFMSGVNQRQRIAIHHRRSGKTAILVFRPFWRQRNGGDAPSELNPCCAHGPSA